MINKNTQIDYCVYRYLSEADNQILYVGKTNASLKQRIDAHKKEEKFIPYLDSCKIEFIYLSNSVETDIIEKYLINQWKPILNEKDNLVGLSPSLFISIPEWKSYKEYKIKNKKELEVVYQNELNIAIMNSKFYDCILEAILDNKNTFETDFLHPTGLLKFPTGYKKVTNKNVKYINGKYIQEINQEIIEEFLQNLKQIEAYIWLPLSKYHNFPPKDKNEYIYLLKQFDKEQDDLEDVAKRIICFLKCTDVIPYEISA